MVLEPHEASHTPDGRSVENQETSYARWFTILRHVLSSLIAYDLLNEIVDSTATVIIHSGITLTSHDVDASLSDLDTHPLTILLEEQLSPVMEEEDYSAWSFLTSQVIEAFYDDTISTEVDATAERRPAVDAAASDTVGASMHEDTAGPDSIDSGPTAMLAKNECELCERVMPLTIHHLIPRSTHLYFLSHRSLLEESVLRTILTAGSTGKSWKRDAPPPPHTTRTTTTTTMSPADGLTKAHLLAHQARVCRPCHSQIHTLIPDHKELGRVYNTIDSLVERDDIRKWVHYIRAQRGSDLRMGRGLRYRR